MGGKSAKGDKGLGKDSMYVALFSLALIGDCHFFDSQ
jgi:hypothetical protein